MHTVPFKNFIYRKTMSVLHDFLSGCSLLFIYKIADQKIYCLWSADQLFQRFKNLVICLLIYPVIAVYHFKIESCGISDTCIDRFSMTAVLLMDCFDNCRIFLCIGICNLCSAVRGSIIHNQDLNIFSSYKKRFYTFLHICF